MKQNSIPGKPIKGKPGFLLSMLDNV